MNAYDLSSTIERPGERIVKYLKDNDISQKELAIRTGFSEKHISTVLSGQKDVSVAFAKSVERALSSGVTAKRLLLMQAKCDALKVAREERNHINQEECKILKQLKEVSAYLVSVGLLKDTADEIDGIIAMRDFLGVSDLCKIPEITYNAAYRAQLRKNIHVDPYVLFAWQRMCEKLTENMKISSQVNVEALKSRVGDIKKLMPVPACELQKGLQEIFSSCGIAFRIVRHFKGAPVQGFIKEARPGRLILCLTIRQKRRDIFWFTLFHEIAHVIYGDVRRRFVDFDVKSDVEERADYFAAETLIPGAVYRAFVSEGDFSPLAIAKLADSLGVPGYIIYGRLLRDEFLTYTKEVMESLPQYEWAAA